MSWQEDIMKKQFLEMQCLKSCREKDMKYIYFIILFFMRCTHNLNNYFIFREVHS